MQTERDLLTASELPGLKLAAGSTGYARIVRALRYVLAAVVLAVVTTVLLWPELERTAPPKLEQDAQKIASNELVNPKFESVDADGQPFVLSATRAVQDQSNPDRVNLEKPDGALTLKDGAVLKLAAKTGLYQQESQIMDLAGDVRLIQDQGYEMTGSVLTINLKTREVNSTAPVAGSGPLGSITAMALDSADAGKTLIFHGPATLILNEGITP